MNQVILTGRIVKDPVLEHTKNKTSICQFSIATNRPVVRDGKKETDFITCVSWNKLAENLVKYQRKGNLIAVFGELRVDTYEKDGQKRYKNYVLCKEIEYLEAKRNMADDEYEEFNNMSAKTKTQDNIEIQDEDLPW